MNKSSENLPLADVHYMNVGAVIRLIDNDTRWKLESILKRGVAEYGKHVASMKVFLKSIFEFP